MPSIGNDPENPFEKYITDGPPLSQEELVQFDEDGLAKEVKGFGNLMRSDDAKEGAVAFVEKRKAEFKGV